MTTDEKLESLKNILFGDSSNTQYDDVLTNYLEMTKLEILNFKYSLIGIPDDVTDVPAEDEITQIMACADGYAHMGAPGELTHTENGIVRQWKFDDMVAYVRFHVLPYGSVI